MRPLLATACLPAGRGGSVDPPLVLENVELKRGTFWKARTTGVAEPLVQATKPCK